MSLGTQTLNDETLGGGDLSIGAIAPARVSRLGGDKVTLTGVFPTGSTYTVAVGGVLAYSGVSGQGTVIQSDGDQISFVVPPFAIAGIGESVTVLVTRVPESDTVSTTLAVVERHFGSELFEVRRMFPNWYGVGPRRLDLEPQEA